MASATKESRPFSSPPRSIRLGLGRLDLRLRALGALRGWGLFCAVAALGAALGMAADFAWPLPMPARWLIWAGWLLSLGFVLLSRVIRPMIRRAGWIDLAAVAERGHPRLGERLTSAVALLGGRERSHGSPELIAALADDAAARARGLDLGLAVPSRAAYVRSALGMLALGLVVAPAVARPDPFAGLWGRFLAPWAEIDRVSRFVIDVTPGDRVAVLRADLTVSATVRSRFGSAQAPEDAWLEWTDADGFGHRSKMAAESSSAEPTGLRRFGVTLPSLAGSLRYRVASDSARSRRFTITAVEAPAIARLSARVEPPAYTKFPVGPARDPARMEAWEGSRITLSVTANKPVRSVEAHWPRPGPEGKPSAVRSIPLRPSADGKTWTGTVAADVSGDYAFKLVDPYDLESRPEARRRLIVRPDAPPTVVARESAEQREARSDDVLMLDVAARDDLAVASAELHYSVERAKPATGAPRDSGHVAAPLKGLGTRFAGGEAVLALSPLRLSPGDVVSYRIRVTDNLPPPRGPNVGWSAARVLRIVDKAESMLARRASAERGELQAKLNAIKKAAAANRQGTEQLRFAADAVHRGNGRWEKAQEQALDRREVGARDVVEKLGELAVDLEESPSFSPLARPTRQVADVEAEAARATLDEARRAGDSPRRLADLRQADAGHAAVQARLDELQRKFDELVKQDDDRRRLRVLAERQEELAGRAEALKDDPARLGQVQADQENLRRETEALLKQSPALRAEALASQSREAAELAERARAIARRERAEASRTADRARREPAMKALAEAQRVLEEDARRLALKMDAPLAENGKGRVDAGAIARAVEPIERGDLEAGRQHLEAGERELRRIARDLDDLRDDPKALARRLAKRQEELKVQVAEQTREAREKPPETPEARAGLADRLKPLLARQEAIARLAAAIPAADARKEAVRNVARVAELAATDLREPRPREVEGHQNEVRDALNRLADALPDINQRREQAKQKIGEARGKTEEVARELERHLRETGPQAGQPFDRERAAFELARRIAPLADKQREAAALLAALDIETRADPQRERAARRALALADSLKAIKDQAPPPPPDPIAKSTSLEFKPVAAWHVVGAFPIDAAAPFPTDAPVNLDAKYNDRKGIPADWKPISPIDARGNIDLGAIYSKDNNLGAFGYAQVGVPAARPAQMRVACNDSITVWLNGKEVYTWKEKRGYGSDPGKVEVQLAAGVNRLLVRSGNTGGEWMYAVELSQPPVADEPLTKWRVLGVLPMHAPPPVPVDRPVVLDARHADIDGKPIQWKEVAADDRLGKIDLKKHLGVPRDEISAYGYVEVRSARARAARLTVGSDDTLTVWLNGKQVHDYQGRRSYDPNQEHVEVQLVEGANHLFVRCGNGSAEWAFRAALSGDSSAAESKPKTEPRKESSDLANARTALPALQTAARASLERLAQKVDGQVPADDLAAELAEDQREIEAKHADPKDQNPNPADRADEQRRVASAVRNLAAPDAAVAQGEAVRFAERAAQALTDSKADAPRAIAKAAEAVETLARQLADRLPAKEQAEALARAQRALNAPDDPADPNVKASRQRAIAEELARAPLPGKADAADAVGKAVDQAEQAARPEAQGANSPPAPGSPSPEAARARAAKELEALAARQPAPPAQKADGKVPVPARGSAPDDPELGVTPANAAEAAALARRERRIRERLQAVLGERVGPQDELREDAAALGRELANLRDRARETSPRAQGPAQAAAQLMAEQVPQAMAQGAEHLNQGRPDPALEAQRRAADQAEQAARHAEDMAAALLADRPADAPAPADGKGQLAAAQGAQRQAGRELAQAQAQAGGEPAKNGRASQAAAASMRQAAQSLRSAAQGQPGQEASQSLAGAGKTGQGKARGQGKSGRGKGMGKGKGRPTGEPEGTEAGTADPDLSELQAAIRDRTGRAWGELPGHLRTEILQMSQGRYRDDYARLIQLYFREIAAGGPSATAPAADRGPRP